MKLTIKDRVFIPAFLPKEGTRLEMMIVKGLYDKIEFTQEEIELYSIGQTKDGRVTWKEDFEKEVSLTEPETDVLITGIRKTDKEGRVTLETLATIEKLYKILQ